MPPGALTESVQACFSCQNSGRGYCMTSGTCEWLSLSPCGNEPSDYVTPSATTEQVLWENGVFPHGHVCFAVVAPRAPPPAPPAPLVPPSPPRSPPPPPPPSMPPPSPPPPPLICSNHCAEQGWANDGVCDDGGPGSEYAGCEFGYDCEDCSVRLAPSPPPSLPPPPPSVPPFLPPSCPSPAAPADSPPPPPVSPPVVELSTDEVAVDGAVCNVAGGCSFNVELAKTPLLLSTSPAAASPGEMLTLTGHGFSLTAADNTVTVGGEPCHVTSATQNASWVQTCSVGTCTAPRDMIILECTLPPNSAASAHTIAVSVAGYGASPTLVAGTVTYSVRLASVSPTIGSIGGGTPITLTGDGLSTMASDVAITINGVACRVIAAFFGNVTCVTGAASTAATATVAMSVRGVAASCIGSCTFSYSDADTPTLASASVTSSTDSQWTISLSGSSFGSGWSSATVMVGSTACTPVSGSTTSLTCTMTPPMAGAQAVRLLFSWGYAIGSGGGSLPTITGASLSVSGISPATVGMAGGAGLVVSGTGFDSVSSSRATVCGVDCAVTATSSTSLTCTVPSRLVHASGTQSRVLSVTSEAVLDASGGYAGPGTHGGALSMTKDATVALQFSGLTSSTLPRGAAISHANLHVVPHPNSTQGSVSVDVRASVACASDADPLTASALGTATSSSTSVPWDVKPWTLGFANDESPNVASLLTSALDGITDVSGCSVVLYLSVTQATGTSGHNGARVFKDLSSISSVPSLTIYYEPPTTATQLGWAADTGCAVEVSVPTAFTDSDVGSCTRYDVAAGKDAADHNACPHLRMEATAATTAAPCSLAVNGVELLSACDTDKMAAYLDGGVCAASVDTASQPRTACFDTKTEGDGADKLAAWLDGLATGTPVMMASCSRLAWPFNRDEISTRLTSSLGATASVLGDVSDAYAIVGVTGATAPLAEAHLPCCSSLPCGSCAQNFTRASADVSCGATATHVSDTLTAAGLGGQYVGDFGSTAHVAALSAVAQSIYTASSSSTSIVSGTEALAALQAADGDALDAECAASGLTAGNRFGSQLASDVGATNASTYWLSVGRTDAMLDVALDGTTLVQRVLLEWQHPALDVLVLYSADASGTGWTLGGTAQASSAASPPTQVALTTTYPGSATTSTGVMAQRLRVYVTNATGINAAGLPLIALRRLSLDACDYPRSSVTAGTQLSYAAASTPTVETVSPTRGSTAGGTALTLAVSNLPSGLGPSDLSASIAGIVCAVSSVAYDGSGGATVGCTSGAHGRTTSTSTGVGAVELTVAATVGTSVATANGTFTYIDLWSRATTWGGDSTNMPIEGDSVWIQPGQRILLDTSPPKLYMLIVQGDLIFDAQDLTLDASYIFVMGGSFVVGTETEPFTHKATITLHGSPNSKELPLYGAKVLGCRACTLDLHGRPSLDDRTHTKLAATVQPGNATLLLTEAVDWPINSFAVVTSTAANGTMEEAETVVIIGVHNGGYRLELATPLLYRHLGETRSLDGGHSVDFRANVGLISHNVVVQGSTPFSQLDRFGAHVLVHSKGDESLTARLENTEFRFMGQGFRLGRYPIHFHMIGTVRNSYVRYNSVHHTYNRAVAIHGVHYLRVKGNVAFENMGNAYFVEDGIETKNIITHNLGVNTRQSFAGLTVDQTPATYWLVNGDNYVASNIAAGSTHYGFWFFPEPKVRGASEFEPGSDKICPMGTPLLWFADNEAHHCGSYGLRIFTNDPAGEHRGPSGAGFYPVSRDPCAEPSANNTYEPALFRRQYSWRNGKNGVTIGSVAAIHLVDMVVADNNKVGFEFVGADGIQPFSMTSETKLRGPWGANLLIRPVVIGHVLPCPSCADNTAVSLGATHVSLGSFTVPENGVDCLNGCQEYDLGMEQTSDDYLSGGTLINNPRTDGRRIGIETPAWYGLTVQNATFINYDRDGMVAAAGFAKAIPANGLYDFKNCGGMETRFSGTAWLQSPRRVRWRWIDEALFTDVDGTFTENSAGCAVLHNNLVSDPRAFPECYQDERYGGTVCCGLRFVTVGMKPRDTLMVISSDMHSGRISYLPSGSGIYVEATDAAYLKGKWRPEGAHFLIALDASSADPSPSIVGAVTHHNRGESMDGWWSSVGTWVASKTFNVSFDYTDEFDEFNHTAVAQAVVSSDGSELEWVVPATARQLRTAVKWLNCEVRPSECVGPIRYDNNPQTYAYYKNTAQTPHFYGAGMQFQVPLNRRYQFEVGVGYHQHIESLGLWVGPGMEATDWIELETNPYGSYAEYDEGVRPLGSLPMVFRLDGTDDLEVGIESIGNTSIRRPTRRLNGQGGGSLTFDATRETVTIRVEGQAACEIERPFDPCFGQKGMFEVDYAPPPSPPPPSPPSPPPSPPDAPPSPPPPAAPRAFEVAVTVSIVASSLGAQTVTILSDAVGTAAFDALATDEQTTAAIQKGLRVQGELVVVINDASSASDQEAARAAAEVAACNTTATAGVCSVTVQSTGRRLDARRQLGSGAITLVVTLDLDIVADGATTAASAGAVALAAVASKTASSSISSVTSSSLTQVSPTATVAAMGTDGSNVASKSASIQASVASSTSLATSALTVSSLTVAHPPSPPPNPPPKPSVPPPPPTVPPGAPSQPPTPTGWYESYDSTSECDAALCPAGCRMMLWSSTYTWAGQNEQIGGMWPTFRGNVTIKSCSTVILDVNLNVQLYELVIMRAATLIVQNREDANVKLKATCIKVHYGGRLLAGRPTDTSNLDGVDVSMPRCAQLTSCATVADAHLGTTPFAGRLEILLSGDDLTEGSCGQTGRQLIVEGELSLHGKRPSNTWSWLRSTASVGASTLVVQGAHDWDTADELLVAGTSSTDSGTETATVASQRHVPAPGGGFDTELQLTSALGYTHLGVTEIHHGHALSMRAEVALISRPTIMIAGVDETSAEFAFYKMETQYQGAFVIVAEGGVADLSGVHLKDGGCHFPSFTCSKWTGGSITWPFVDFQDETTAAAVSMQGCIIEPNGYGHGVRAASGHFYDNVVYKPASGFDLRGTAVAKYNAIFSVISVKKDLDYTDFDAFFTVVSGTPTIVGNAGAGSGNMGYRFGWFDIPASSFYNNSGHGIAQVGLGFKGGPQRAVTDITLWQVSLIGIWGYVKVDTPTFDKVRLADCKYGIVWGFVGGDPDDHVVRMQTLTLSNSLFVGRTASNPSCNSWGEQVGILLAIAGSEGFSISPTVCGPLGGHWTKGIYGMEHPTGSAPAIAAETHVTGCTFAGFDNSHSCGSSHVMMTLTGDGQESSDAVPPIFFQNTNIDATSRANLAYLPPPQREWIVPTRCVAMDCDGPKHVLIHDLDGTLTGNGGDSSILARAEFMHETRDDASEYTWYNIPTKMLYDPAPLNDAGDTGHDMSAFMNYSNGAQSYNYRRRRKLTQQQAEGESGVPAFDLEAISRHRRLASTVESDWRQRMVFYTGDEAAFYQGLDGTTCAADQAAFDPSCRTPRKTHAQVAYKGYGTYREGCTYVQGWNAWSCTNASLTPARLIVESMDADHKTRSLVPVALASGGYVDLMNGGWDHQRAIDCGGYNCLQRLMTFHTTVALRRNYDLAFTGTNPQHLRLMLPSGAGHPETHATFNQTKVLISTFYSNSQTLQVVYKSAIIPPLGGMQSYNFSARKPTVDDPCGTNYFAAWESKMYVVLCGGTAHAIDIKTVDLVTLSIGIEVSVDDFFDAQYLVRNIASLFGIPASRLKIPKIVAGSLVVEMQIEAEDTCATLVCGTYGHCFDGACVCDDGYVTPEGCGGGECTCSQQSCAADCLGCVPGASTCTSCDPKGATPLLSDGRCIEGCPTGTFEDASGACLACAGTCSSCEGPAATQCTACDPIGVNAFLQDGACLLSCSAGYSADLYRVCHKCHADCLTCSGPKASQCTSCLYNVCLKSTCPSTVKPLLAGTSCVSACEDGKFALTNGTCGACHPACQICKAGPANTQCVDPTPTTAFTSADCAVGATRAGGACNLPCPDGTWPQGASGECRDCLNYDCAVCDSSTGTTCLKCKGAWGVGFDMTGIAPIGQAVLPAFGAALPWIRKNLLNGSCFASCPSGMFSDSRDSCVSCATTCVRHSLGLES